MILFDDFTQQPDPHWTQTCIGAGELQCIHSALRMSLPPTPQDSYADAQIDDYSTLARAQFPWRPPLSMTVRARSSLPAATRTGNTEDKLRGTAGFGFWNYPFSPRGDILMLPEAVWFFYASPPSNMALVPGSPGWGWKAQVVHTMRKEAALVALPTALAIGRNLLSKRERSSQSAARWLQRLSGTQERLLDAIELTEWHTYTLEWHREYARFQVDGLTVLDAAHPPTRAMGFVAWLDNQYAIATPRGEFHFGATHTDEQWFELDHVRIERLTA
jgi:hypothetical protein